MWLRAFVVSALDPSLPNGLLPQNGGEQKCISMLFSSNWYCLRSLVQSPTPVIKTLDTQEGNVHVLWEEQSAEVNISVLGPSHWA